MDWVILGIPVGIILLYFGSEWMVSGAKRLALRLGVTPFVVGLTVVAFGSSAPEAITSVVSTGTPDIIIGNIVGSNIANVGLAIGLAAILRPMLCKYDIIKFELISMMVATVVVTLLALNGTIGSIEGIILVLLLFAFVYLVYVLKKDGYDEKEPVGKDMSINMPKQIVMVAAGLVALFFGAQWFVDGAIYLAESFNVSTLLIGLIVVAVGTSLPELCICLMAAWKKEHDLVVSNIVGSVIFNSFFALGIGAILVDIPISEGVLVYHLPIMILMSVLLFLMVRTRNTVTRPMGAMLLVIYIAYVAIMIINPTLAV